MSKKRILSGIQPTGDLHLGNYFGAVKNWVDLQNDYECNFCVVNFHTMTMPYDPALMRENTWKMVFQLLACGINPDYLFIQSLVPEHAELCWILGCTCSYGELSRMTQFKDKSDQLLEQEKESSFVSAGLFYYPVLQAADILLYHADYVPVGKDQEQHLELSRNIAERFNRMFGKEYFACPEPLYTEVPKLLSLANPDKKMSKSLGPKHYLNLFADDDQIRKQVKTAVTDTGESAANSGMSPGVANLFVLLKACNAMDAHNTLMAQYETGRLRYSELKSSVGDALIQLITPFRDNLAGIYDNRRVYEDKIYESSAKIRQYAQKTMAEVRELTGLMAMR